MEKPLIGLVMCVRNEEKVLPRLFASLRGFIDTWTIVDTGSTDDTIEVIRACLGDIPGTLRRHKWQNYGRNGTLAFRAALDSATWLLKLDADFTVEASPGLRDWLEPDPCPEVDAWMVELRDGAQSWRLPWLVRGNLPWTLRRRVHEYLDLTDRIPRPLLGLTLRHHGDGADRGPEKLERWLSELEPGYRKGDPRDTFYYAETLRYLNRTVEAVAVYEERAAMNGYEEERWYATYQSAKLRSDMNRLVEAWQLRPWRHEPLTAAARIAALLGEHVSDDVLFRETLR